MVAPLTLHLAALVQVLGLDKKQWNIGCLNDSLPSSDCCIAKRDLGCLEPYFQSECDFFVELDC